MLGHFLACHQQLTALTRRPAQGANTVHDLWRRLQLCSHSSSQLGGRSSHRRCADAEPVCATSGQRGARCQRGRSCLRGTCHERARFWAGARACSARICCAWSRARAAPGGVPMRSTMCCLDVTGGPAAEATCTVTRPLVSHDGLGSTVKPNAERRAHSYTRRRQRSRARTWRPSLPGGRWSWRHARPRL